MGLFWLAFWGVLSGLVVTAGVRARARRRAALAAALPAVDDEVVRSIVSTGTISVEGDEPLDQREIDEEEARFWSEAWDEPEEL